MKFLKIENNKVFYLKDKVNPTVWTEIDILNKTDLLKLLDYASEDDFKMDDYDESLIMHKAHQIIYKSLFEKFSAFLMNKSRFKDESESLYLSAVDKYK